MRPQRKSQEWQQEYYTSYQCFNPTNFNADGDYETPEGQIPAPRTQQSFLGTGGR